MRYSLACLFFYFCILANGQTAKIDSLEQLARKASGPVRVDILNQLVFEVNTFDNKRADSIVKMALELSNAINYQEGKAKSLILLGEIDSYLGNKKSAIKNLKEGIALSKKLKNKYLQGYGLTILGSYFKDFNHMDSAMMSFNSAYELLKDGKNLYYLSYLYVNFADYFKVQNELDLQLSYLKKSWEIRIKQPKGEQHLVWLGELLASYYTEIGMYNEAHSYLLRVQQEMGKDTIDNQEISFIYRQRAIVYINQGKFSQAFDLLIKAKKWFTRAGDILEIIDTQSEIGYVYMDMANYELSLKNYFEALKLADKYRYGLLQTKLLFRIAWVYYELKQNKLSLEYVTRCLSNARRYNLKSEEASALNLLGLIADSQHRYTDAFNYLTKALTIRRNIHKQNDIASTLNNLGTLLEHEGKLQEALKYDLESLAIEETSGHQYGIAQCNRTLGGLYNILGEYDKSLSYFNKAEKIALEIEADGVLLEVFKNKRGLLIGKQRFREAAMYSLQYDNLKDSIFSQSLSDRISNLQNIFQLETKNNEITILNQQKELQQRRIELQQNRLNQQWIIISIGALGFLILLVFVIFIYRYYVRIKFLNKQVQERSEEIQTQSEELTEANAVLSKLNRAISEQKEEIQAQAEELTESNQLISGMNETLEARIENRTSELKQAYKELDTFFYRSSHDFRRPLTTFMGLAEVAKITLKDSVALDLFDKVNETAHNLDKMLTKLQSISDLGIQELMQKEIFVDEIFRQGCDLYGEELLHLGIKVNIEVDPKLFLRSYPALIKIITTNLIENAISFRTPENPTITLRGLKELATVRIEVEDNGCGIHEEYLSRIFDMYFRANEQSKGNGLGLYIVKKAVDKLNGSVSIFSQVGVGTKVTLTFPLHLE